jgi:hypothetical protein
MPPLSRAVGVAFLLASTVGFAPAALAQTAPAGVSVADRARELADARPWAGMIFAGSSVADGKLRDIIVAPWSGS